MFAPKRKKAAEEPLWILSAALPFGFDYLFNYMDFRPLSKILRHIVKVVKLSCFSWVCGV
jgi:hypothetical protein